MPYALIVIAFLAAFFPVSSRAQCLVYPEPGRDVWGVGQETILVVRAGTRARYRVALIPRVELRGDAAEFGTLVPTPSVPTLTSIGQTVFDEATLVTRPIYRPRSFFSGGCGGSDIMYETPVAAETGDDRGVTVLQERTVGSFETVVLSAESSSELAAWLDKHGYASGIEDARVFDEYIANRWVFTAMRLRRVALPNDVYYWRTAPVMLQYETDALTYPMRLAALTASPSDATRLSLTVVADERMTFDGARTRYANRISRKELERIRADAPVFGGLLSEGAFLTKATREYSIFDDKEDFNLRATESREFQETTPSYLYAAESLGALCLLGWRARRALRRKGSSA